MWIFNLLTLLGGLAMFLYGMRVMGDGLKTGSGATMKKAMESVTNNPIKAFLLGLAVTAIIQSSTATIVITSGLVGAGVLSLRQSLGIIVGANVGTTVTGQIIRLLDLNSSSTAWLQVFKPSTLAPVALILGVVLIMFIKKSNSDTVGKVAIGFGILFTGLMNMTGSVDTLSEAGVFDAVFTGLGASPVLGYISGVVVSFILQSSSATVGILQALSSSGQLTFRAVYAILVGIYLGDCVTTAIVCAIGAKPDARRVGWVHILFNLFKTVLVFALIAVAYSTGLLNRIWDAPINSGGIANANSVFNIISAVALFPMLNLYERWSRVIVKDEAEPQSKYADKLEALSPNFFGSPVLALNACHSVLVAMHHASTVNIMKAFSLLEQYDEKLAEEVIAEEDNIDLMADRVGNYLVALSPYIRQAEHARILDEYYKVNTEFERLGDHAVNVCETAQDMRGNGIAFSSIAREELQVVADLIERILDRTGVAFERRDVEAAREIEPLEEVVDDIVNALKDNHISRLREGKCSVVAGTDFLNLLSDIERISDVCSNVGVATVTRVEPELATEAHSYISHLHSGKDEVFNAAYSTAHEEYFSRLDRLLNSGR